MDVYTNPPPASLYSSLSCLLVQPISRDNPHYRHYHYPNRHNKPAAHTLSKWRRHISANNHKWHRYRPATSPKNYRYQKYSHLEGIISFIYTARCVRLLNLFEELTVKAEIELLTDSRIQLIGSIWDRGCSIGRKSHIVILNIYIPSRNTDSIAAIPGNPVPAGRCSITNIHCSAIIAQFYTNAIIRQSCSSRCIKSNQIFININRTRSGSCML